MSLNEVFKEFPVIETERVILRELKEEDAEELYNYYSDEKVYKYLDWNGPSSVEDAKKCIAIWRRGFEERWIIRWAILTKTDNKLIGTVFYGDMEGDFSGKVRADIGYELSRECWNEGIMTEVLKALIPFGFQKLGLYRIQAIANPENTTSIHLLKKVGLQEEGLLRGYEYNTVRKEFNDVIMLSILKED